MAKETDDQRPNPIFEIGPGYYYLALASVCIPEQLSMFGKGGDILLMVFRKLEEPTQWNITMRFRYYRDLRVFESKDVKRVRRFELTGDEATVERQFRAATGEMAGAILGDSEIFWIRGGEAEFKKKIETNPPDWMHRQQQLDA